MTQGISILRKFGWESTWRRCLVMSNLFQLLWLPHLSQSAKLELAFTWKLEDAYKSRNASGTKLMQPIPYTQLSF